MDSSKDEEKKYEEDSRMPCKYGTRCYQKNPGHHKKFKHPPKQGNVNKEVISKKRKSPEDSESSSSNAPKIKKPDTPSKDEDPSDKKTEASKVDEDSSDKKTEPSKVDEKVTNDETNSTEVTKKDSEEAIKSDNDSTTEKVTGDKTGTNTDKKADNSETETPSEQEKTNKINDVNNVSNTEGNEERIKTEEEDTKVEVKSTDDAADKKTETKVDKVEKGADDKSDAQNIKEKDSKRPNNEEKVPASPKQNIEEKKSNVKSEISKDVDYSKAKRLIQKAFLVPMPSDFYKFYDFCKEVKPSDPSTALSVAELKLVGPYDVLNGLITEEIVGTTNLLTHWRYYYDPPEFQTVIKGNDREGLHFGYWRDRPSSDPVFVATNCSNVSHKIKPVAENIFGAVAYYIEERIKKATPFEKAGLSSLLGKVKAFAKKHNISLETQSAKMKSREKNVVARTIHGAGIVCPYNKKSQLGYRELSVTDNQLLKIVKKIDDAQNEEERMAARSELGEVVRLATIAGDECDFGTCLELGHDLLSTGCSYVQNAALAVLSIAYNQLDRQAFLKIIEAHLQNRKKSSNPSALENVSKE